MRTAYVAVYLVLSVLGTAMFFPKYFWLKYFSKDARAQFLCASRVSNWWGKKVFRSTGSSLEIIGKENLPKDGTFVVISNHQSHFDLTVLMGYLGIPFGIIAKIELSKFPIFSTWMRYFKCIFIDRGNPRQSVLAIEQAVQNIKNGYSMLVFPEGTRSKSNKMGTFKSGSLKIATKTQAPILPVTINGTYNIFEGNSKFEIKKAHVKMTIHKPIYFDELSDEDKKNIAGYVQNVVASAL